jgi:hypothetical protein
VGPATRPPHFWSSRSEDFEEKLAPLYEAKSQIRVYGSDRANQLAAKITSSLQDFLLEDGTHPGPDDSHAFLQLVRKDSECPERYE